MARGLAIALLVGIAPAIGTTAAAQQLPPATPARPGGSLLGPAPGAMTPGPAGGAGVGGPQEIIGGRPGPSMPRVPQGLTQPGQPFQAEGPLGLPLQPTAPGAVLPLFGNLTVPPGGEPAPAPGGLTLDQAIGRLLEANLELRARALELPKAEADILTAGLWANPLLYFDTQLVPYARFADVAGPTQYDLNINHPIDLNGKWRKRVEVANKNRGVVGAQYQDAVRVQVDNLYTAWIDALAAQETIRFLRTSLQGLGELLRVTEALAARGAATEADVKRVRIQVDSTRVALVEAEETERDARRTLALLLNLPPGEGETLVISGSLRPPMIPIPPVEELTEMAMASRPDLAAFQLGVERAYSEVRLAEANRFQDIFVLYQPYTYQRNHTLGAGTSWALGVTVPLPVYDRNQGNIAKAQHTVAQTRLQLADLQRQVAAQVRRAERALAVTEGSVRRLEGEILVDAGDALKTSYDLYRSGEKDLISYLQAQRDYNDVARQYRDALVRYRRAALRLNTVVGQRIFP